MVDTDLLTGCSATLAFSVDEADLATALGSGDVPVLGTPRLIAWCEAACVEAVQGSLPEGSTSVGTAIDMSHVAACAVGASVVVSATVISYERRTVVFDIEAVASSANGRPSSIGYGTITRSVVDRQRFLANLART